MLMVLLYVFQNNIFHIQQRCDIIFRRQIIPLQVVDCRIFILPVWAYLSHLSWSHPNFFIEPKYIKCKLTPIEADPAIAYTRQNQHHIVCDVMLLYCPKKMLSAKEFMAVDEFSTF